MDILSLVNTISVVNILPVVNIILSVVNILQKATTQTTYGAPSPQVLKRSCSSIFTVESHYTEDLCEIDTRDALLQRLRLVIFF